VLPEDQPGFGGELPGWMTISVGSPQSGPTPTAGIPLRVPVFVPVTRSVADPNSDPIHMFLVLLDPHPDPLKRGMDPDPSIIKQKY